MASWRFLPWPGRVGDLAISIRGLRENDRWRMLADLDGQPFSSWEDFCQYPEPYGLGLSLDQVEAILDRSNAGKRLSAVLGGHGGDRRSPEARKDQGSRRTLKRGETSEYLEARLRRSHKDIAAAYDRGEFKSLKAAARKAGIVKDPDPLRELKRWWGRASDCDRAQFEGFIDAWHQEQAGAAGHRASRVRTLSLRRRKTSPFPADGRHHRAAVLAADVQIDLLAVALRRQLAEVPLAGVDPQARSVDVLVVGDPVAVGVDDEVAGSVVGDVEQLVGHGIKT
jgi:hypothetical protein